MTALAPAPALAAAPETSRAAERRPPQAPVPARQVLGALIRDQLHDQRTTALVWGLGLGAMGALMVLIWPTIQSAMADLVKLYPANLRDAFGIGSMNSVERYLDGELFGILVPLTLAVLAVRGVAKPTVGAEDAGQLETWLTMPVSRRILVWSSFVSAGVTVAAVLTVLWAVIMMTSVITGAGVSAGVLAAGLVNVWPLAMAFAGLAALVAGLLRGSARVTGVVLGVLAAMYVLDMVGKLAPSLSVLRDFSAFRLYGSAVQNGLDGAHLAGLICAAIALTALGAEAFERRDV